MSSEPSESSKTGTKRPPRAGRRLKRGHKAEAEAQAQAQAEAQAAAPAPVRKRAVKSVRQLDREAFAQVDRMIASFAQRRFGGLMPSVARGFLGGARSEAETKLPEVQQAFALFFVYGYRDNAGRRIIDMFREYGLKLDREQGRVLDALERTRLVVFAVEGKNEANKQIVGRDLLRGQPMTGLDHNLFSKVGRGDVVLAYMFPVGDMWRPLGMATMVRRARVRQFDQGLGQLAREQGFAAAELGERRPGQLFWLAYRVAEGVVRSKA
ncbi:hypothetical protein G6O69_06840 [Pseudenhygromyxa sp. WMMC2535]|uniref:hypothetical protein n=1 Tax=Pseudenhygromyxa sp. WMMC2535 TaxID=2712867 RepID=UPI0015525D62|nr:hypothetical protein [Pseudenhygromyxa sp. WMMC2535]NVB37542.1 hypothetical protein [Pseudenhygromyxa sp. WMMC2535]